MSISDIDFDLACWFFGDDIVAIVKAEDGLDIEDPPTNWYVRNVNPRLRTLQLAAAPVVILELGEVEMAFEEWLSRFDDDKPWPCSDLTGCEGPGEYFGAWNEGTPYWLTIIGGRVIKVHQQYTP